MWLNYSVLIVLLYPLEVLIPKQVKIILLSVSLQKEPKYNK